MSRKNSCGFLSSARSILAAISAALVLIILSGSTAQAVEARHTGKHVVVRLKDGVPQTFSESAFGRSQFFKKAEVLIPSMNLYLVELQEGFALQSALQTLNQYDQVKYAQPDHYVTLRSELPNDVDFSKQWSLYNLDNQVDIGASDAWALSKGGKDVLGNDIVIAVVDGGVDVTHPDLVPNLWVNQKEIPGNGVDDDENGYVDDIHGWNAYKNSGDMQSSAHGTHVAGIAGAAGNNGQHITGVNWDVKIMAIPGSSGTTSTIARAYGYALAQKKLWLESNGEKGANVVVTNSSFGIDFADCTSSDFPLWNDIYNEMGNVGILSAAATPNRNVDVDVVGDVPTGCDSEFIVSVTNTQKSDVKYPSAGFGVKHVDLGAPGTNILSTIPGAAVGQMTGTSMATPHVAGAIAFLHSVGSADFNSLNRATPADGARAIKKLLLDSVEPNPSLSGVTASGGRLHLGRAAKSAAAFTR